MIPLRERAMHRLMCLERKKVNCDWAKYGGKRLSPLTDVTNVVHERAKRDSALEINASDVKSVAKEKIKDNVDL